MDNRAQAIGIFRMFLGLIVGAVVTWLVSLVADPILTKAGESGTDATSAQGTAWLQTGMDYLPILFLMIAFFGLIAYSVFRREVVR